MSKFTFKTLKESSKFFADKAYTEGLNYLRANCQQTPRIKGDLDKLERFINTGAPQFSVWVEGNDKLPFLSFSGLAGEHTCPGANECLAFCYSFKGWRMFTPFLRQVQNMMLLDSAEGLKHIASTLDAQLSRRKFKKAIAAGKSIPIRLYVDGDFRTTDDIQNWFDIITERPVKVYGYSKSLDLFWYRHLSGLPVPKNYVLNLSGGGKYDHLHDILAPLPWVRGRFVACPVVVKSMAQVTREDKHTMLQWAQKEFDTRRNFVCPGKCGTCVKGRHACGDLKFQGVNIVIPTH